MKFRDHKYTWRHDFMTTQHQWSFRGPRGGIHFTASLMDDQEKYPDPSCGLEFHHAFDPSGGREAPHHTQCWVIGGPCWHDGTSHFASETVWPLVKRWLSLGNHDAIFRYLESLYDDHFEKDADHG